MMHKRNYFERASVHTDEGVINLTPLIDVVFVVLILFILVAPLLDIDRLTLAPAAKDAKKEKVSLQETPIIKIEVFADNSIWLNHQLISEKELPLLLKKAWSVYPHAIPQVFQDKHAFFGTYQIVKNAIESAGFEEMDVVLKPGE